MLKGYILATADISMGEKKMKVGKQKSLSGQIAIFWVDVSSKTCKVYSNKSSLHEGDIYGQMTVHKSCHYDSWNAIRRLNPKWTGQYEDYPRGRCTFNLKNHRFFIYVCPLVKDNKKAQDNIVKEFHLQKSKYRFFYDDEHYVLQQY